MENQNVSSNLEYEPMDIDSAEVKSEFIEVDETPLVYEDPIKEEDLSNEDPLAVAVDYSSSINITAASNLTPRLCYVLLNRIDSEEYIGPDISTPSIAEDVKPSVSQYTTGTSSIWQIPYKSETNSSASNDSTANDSAANDSAANNSAANDSAANDSAAEVEPLPVPKKRRYKKYKKSKPYLKYVCEFCPQRFKNRDALDDHEDTHPQMIRLTCKYCKKRFGKRAYVLCHIKKWHWEDEQKIKDEKEKAFQEKLALIEKRKKVEEEERITQLKIAESKKNIEEKKLSSELICSICDKLFKTKHCLKEHDLVVHKNERKYQCTKCNKAFKKSNHLKNHTLGVHLKSAYYCKLCNKTYRFSSNLYAHMTQSHNKNQVELKTCDKCNHTFKRITAYNTHIEKLNKTGKCPPKKRIPSYYRPIKHRCFCADIFKNENDLNDHIFYVHKRKDDTYICIDCKKTFKIFEYFKIHLATYHLNKTYYPCHHCENILVSKDSLHKHYKYYHNLKLKQNTYDYFCDFCQVKYMEKEQLEYHIKLSHLMKKRKYFCVHCLKSYNLIMNLKHHNKRRHSDIKPGFMCHVCSKIFDSKDELAVHQIEKHKIEIGTCNLECDVCKRKFDTQMFLDLHKVLKHAEVVV